MKETYSQNDAINDNFNSKYRKPYRRRINDAILIDLLTTIPTSAKTGIPIIKSAGNIKTPDKLVSFESLKYNSDLSTIGCHFYIDDFRFIRTLDNPAKYLPLLRKCGCVICPDFSQYVKMASFARYSNSCWNKAIGSFWQMNGVNIIPNVTWSTPDSYKYSFEGIPKKSIIAINSNGCKKNSASIYLWRKGYEEAINKIEPSVILRYGLKMPGEYSEISVYYDNPNFKRNNNGR